MTHTGPVRNPHAGAPFADDDAAIAAALAEVNVPALLCSLVHMTGDPTWIRERTLPRLVPRRWTSSAGSRRGRAGRDPAPGRCPVVAAYRDSGCEPHDAPRRRPARDDVLPRQPHPSRRPDRADAVRGHAARRAPTAARSPGAPRSPTTVKAASPVVVIGCGMAGILAGIRLTQAGLPFTIIEKNDGPGGTWWENRYPGARVDVGSHQYCYSFEPADHWSEYYCQHPELRDVLRRRGRRRTGLAPHCRFGTTVTAIDVGRRGRHAGASAVADRRRGARRPRGAVRDQRGRLAQPPEPSRHPGHGRPSPARRSTRPAGPTDLDIAGSRVRARSAPARAGSRSRPRSPTTSRRSRSTSARRSGCSPTPCTGRQVPPGDRWAQRHLPFYGALVPVPHDLSGHRVGDRPVPHRSRPRRRRQAVPSTSSTRSAPPALEAWIRVRARRPTRPARASACPTTPRWASGSSRTTATWLRCLCKPNVELVRTGDRTDRADGVVTVDGTLREADVICFATGFRHNDFLAPMEVIGRDGVSLREQWGDEPTAYLGITVPNFPNLFCVYGPGTNLAHSASLFFHSEYQVGHAMDAIRFTLASGASDHRGAPGRRTTPTPSGTSVRSAQLVWAHPVDRATATTRTRTARCSRSRRGRSTSTGS